MTVIPLNRFVLQVQGTGTRTLFIATARHPQDRPDRGWRGFRWTQDRAEALEFHRYSHAQELRDSLPTGDCLEIANLTKETA